MEDQEIIIKCDKCNIPCELCEADEPWHDEYWICPYCDGTYCKTTLHEDK